VKPTNINVISAGPRTPQQLLQALRQLAIRDPNSSKRGPADRAAQLHPLELYEKGNSPCLQQR
jgi:hypothetical protein